LYYKNESSQIIITCGDINGIGPEICLKSLQRFSKSDNKFLLIIPKNIFDKACSLINFSNDFAVISNTKTDFSKSNLNVLFLRNSSLSIGRPSVSSGKTSYEALETAHKLIQNRISDILVTAPISKESFELSDINFPGHTELLGSWFNTNKYLMTFISKSFKAALLTIHEPLSKVSKIISKPLLKNKLNVLINSAKNDFGKNKFKIAVLGFNPHAGEKGRIGNEEINLISPVIKNFSKFNIQGPFVPDAFFANKLFREFDFVFGMYHDQILIPFKMVSFNKGVNFTAGLPIIRTSPDHGTAYDIAWQNKADESSMTEAIKWAVKIKSKRKIILND
jgi:4-hydroxythreonine-4-phosphate dehydrogenase